MTAWRLMSIAALAVGLIAVLISAVGIPSGWIGRQQFFIGYLFAYLFWLGISLGSMAILMLHQLTGGGWGVLIRRPLVAATSVMPVMALLYIPILLGLQDLYVWARPEAIAHDPILSRKSWYLNESFFVARAVFYFAICIPLALTLIQWVSTDRAPSGRLQRLSAGGLVIYALIETFAAFDWIMSLTPHWYSSTFGLLVGIGQMLAAFAFATALTSVLALHGTYVEAASPLHFHDLGKLLLMFVLSWGYLAYMQYLIIWFEDLPPEISWYLPRGKTSWRGLGLFIIAFQLVVPFLVLLSHNVKRNPATLGTVATLLLFVGWVNVFWLVAPSFRMTGFQVLWSDILISIGIGGVWLGIFLIRFGAQPLRSDATREAIQHG